MKLRLTSRALADLDDINAWLTPRSPQGALKVKAAILTTFETLKTLPHSGRLQTTPGVRKLAVPQCAYNIYYGIDDDIGEIIVFTIFHASRERAYTDA